VPMLVVPELNNRFDHYAIIFFDVTTRDIPDEFHSVVTRQGVTNPILYLKLLLQ